MRTIRRLAFLALLSVFMAVPACGTVMWPDVWGALKKCDNIDWSLATRVFGDLVEVVQGNPAGEADLTTLLAADTVGAVPCLLAYFENAGGSTATAAMKFSAAHKSEIEKARARGGAAALRCPGTPVVARLSPADLACATRCGDGGWSSGPSGCVCLTPTIPKAEGGDTSRTSAVAIPLRESVPAPTQAGVAPGDSSASPAKPAFAYPGETVASAAARCDAACGTRDAIGSPGADCLCQRKVDGRLTWVAVK